MTETKALTVVQTKQPNTGLDKYAFEPHDWTDAANMAEALCRSGLMPADLKSPSAALMVIMMGRELGLMAVQAIRSIYIVKGKPAPSAQLMVALVLSSGKAEYFDLVSTTETEATFKTKRVGAAEIRHTFTLAEAQRAGITSNPTWKNYVRQMLRARCSSELARIVYPDIVLGLHAAEELTEQDPQELRSATPNQQAAAEIIDQPPEQKAETIDLRTRLSECKVRLGAERFREISQLGSKPSREEGLAALTRCEEEIARLDAEAAAADVALKNEEREPGREPGSDG